MSIKKQILSGTFFIASAKYISVGASILVTAILARIIPPEMFAIVAITSVISNFFNLFSDFGIAAAIIQKQDLDKNDYRNIFSFCIYAGIVLSSLFFASSYLFEFIYKNNQLGTLIQLLTLQVFFISLNITPNALIIKAKNFGFIAVRTIITSIVTGVIAIVAALNGCGIFSLLIIPILTAILQFIINYIKIGGLCFYLQPQWQSLQKIFSYSSYNLLYNIINYFSRNLDTLIIGKFMPFKELAFYEKSYTLMMMPIQNIISVVNPVIHPVLSKYQNDSSYIYSFFTKTSRLFAWIGFPLSVILHAYSTETIIILLGHEWTNAIPIFSIFALSIGFQFIYTLQGPFFLVSNAPKKMFVYGTITMLLNTAALLIGLFIFKSTTSIATCIGISYMLSVIFTFYPIYKHHFKVNYINFFKNIQEPIYYSIVYLIILYSLQQYFTSTFVMISKACITIILAAFTVFNVKKHL